MSKYTNEFKLKVVKYVLEEHHGYADAGKQFNVNHEQLRMWVKKYETYGISGLLKNKIKYDGFFKQNVVEYMHNNHLSLAETSVKFNLGNANTVAKWERIYYEEGPQALFEERRGRRKDMSSKPSKKKLSNEIEEDLIEEVQRLRMEVAYLKKLRALVQERENRENQTKHKPSVN